MRLARIVSLFVVLALAAPAATSADRLISNTGPTFASVGGEMVAYNGFIYFAADTPGEGNELWRSDGTQAGTTLVADLYAGPNDSDPANLTVVGDRLYFNARPGSSQSVSTVNYIDGSAPTTVQQAQARFATSAGTETAVGGIFGAVDGKALIARLQGETSNSNYAVYALGDNGTVFEKISNGYDNIDTTNVFQPSATVGGWAYYIGGNFQPGTTDGYELWRTNGATTQKVKDIVPGQDGSTPRDFVATANRLFFTANTPGSGRELWVSDGTMDGTFMVHEHQPGNASTSIDLDTASNGNVLYYVPNDATTGQEPWRTDGTIAGTRVVKDITPGPQGHGRTQLFSFRAGFGMQRGDDVLYSDGTEAGTTLLVTTPPSGFEPDLFLAAGDRAYFRAPFSGFGTVVWRTDGTPAGTLALTAAGFEGIPTGSSHPFPGPFAALGDRIVFAGRFPGSGSQVRIYALDRTQADPVRQAAAPPTISGSTTLGSTLTGNRGTWTLEPNLYDYAWLRNGTPIANQSGTTYRTRDADAGAQIAFRVTARGPGGPNSVTVVSAPVTMGAAPAAAPTPAPVATPAPRPRPTASPVPLRTLTVTGRALLRGKPRVGSRLVLRLPKPKVSGVRFAFRWFANGKRIKKQSKSSLKLTAAHRGKRISAQIVLTKAGYRTLVLRVAATKRVARR